MLCMGVFRERNASYWGGFNLVSKAWSEHGWRLLTQDKNQIRHTFSTVLRDDKYWEEQPKEDIDLLVTDVFQGGPRSSWDPGFRQAEVNGFRQRYMVTSAHLMLPPGPVNLWTWKIFIPYLTISYGQLESFCALCCVHITIAYCCRVSPGAQLSAYRSALESSSHCIFLQNSDWITFLLKWCLKWKLMPYRLVGFFFNIRRIGVYRRTDLSNVVIRRLLSSVLLHTHT